MTRTTLALLALATACSRPSPTTPASTSPPSPRSETTVSATPPPPLLPPIPGRIAEFLTAEGIPFERNTIEPSMTLRRTYMRGLAGYDNEARTPWGEFRFSDDLVLLGFSIGYYNAPEPRAGDPSKRPEEVAREWLQRHRPDLVALIDSHRVEVSTRASPAATYFDYTRIRVDGEVSVYPLEAHVTILSSCNCVRTFQAGRRDFSRTTLPQLDEAAARALIQQRYRRVAIDHLELQEALTATGSRTTYVARITVALPGIHDTHPHVLWVFDADTGETIKRLGDPTEPDIRPPLPDGVSE